MSVQSHRQQLPHRKSEAIEGMSLPIVSKGDAMETYPPLCINLKRKGCEDNEQALYFVSNHSSLLETRVGGCLGENTLRISFRETGWWARNHFESYGGDERKRPHCSKQGVSGKKRVWKPSLSRSVWFVC